MPLWNSEGSCHSTNVAGFGKQTDKGYSYVIANKTVQVDVHRLHYYLQIIITNDPFTQGDDLHHQLILHNLVKGYKGTVQSGTRASNHPVTKTIKSPLKK